MLVEVSVVEQRYQAVLEVLGGGSVTEVARRNGVARQTVHDWLRRYAGDGLAGLADRSSRPVSCPHQMAAVVEASVVGMRRAHPGWGPSRIVWRLERDGVTPVPSRSAVYRALLRHGLVEGAKRRRRREDYRRWERGRSRELWQMDVMGRAFLADGRNLPGAGTHRRRTRCDRCPSCHPPCCARSPSERGSRCCATPGLPSSTSPRTASAQRAARPPSDVAVGRQRTSSRRFPAAGPTRGLRALPDRYLQSMILVRRRMGTCAVTFTVTGLQTRESSTRQRGTRMSLRTRRARASAVGRRCSRH